jgi:hypothetical protein
MPFLKRALACEKFVHIPGIAVGWPAGHNHKSGTALPFPFLMDDQS